jgi:hypothetical protein
MFGDYFPSSSGPLESFSRQTKSISSVPGSRYGERMRVGLRIGGRQVNGKRVKVEFYSR